MKKSARAMLGALLLSSSLMVMTAPLPSFAQSKPDTYVHIGPLTKESHAVKGTIEKIVVTVGNLSPFPSPPNVHYVAILRVFNTADQLVCTSNTYYSSLPPNASLPALQFQVAHPSPITQLGPAQAAQQKGSTQGPPLAEVGRVPNFVQYRILANLSPTPPCPQVDMNCNNNQLNPTIQFSAGGTPSCLKLQ
jgi:hypothetical protein